MLKKISAAVVAMALSTGVWAAEGSGSGTVNKVKSDAEKLNVTHGPIEGLMDGMTMDFEVMDPAMLDEVAAGDKIDFTVEESDGRYVITDLQVTGKGAVASGDDGHDHQH